MKTKNFDTISMKRQAQEKISKQIKGLSENELLEFWNQFTLKDKKNKISKRKIATKKKI